MTLILLSAITADQRAQPRSAIAVDKVTEYTDDMDRGDRFPPLVVFHDGKKNWLADGFHRFYAATNCALESIDCEVKQGGLRDAILFSVGANASHGLRRTNEDKRRAVAKLLDDEAWSGWSDNEIARRCAVDPKTVAAIRKDVASQIHTKEIHSTERTFVHHKTGEPATMDTSKIGGRASLQPSPSLIEEPNSDLIAKSLREIEKYMDMMPAPEDAASHFPEDQRYMYPVSKLESMGQWFVEFAASWRANIVGKVHGNAAP